MILKGNTRKKWLKGGTRLIKEIDLSVDTGHMSHHNVPLPLKPKSPISPRIGEMLTSLDTIPKQILRQKGMLNNNNKKLKHIKSHQKQEHESKRSKQLLKKGVKNNQDNDG